MSASDPFHSSFNRSPPTLREHPQFQNAPGSASPESAMTALPLPPVDCELPRPTDCGSQPALLESSDSEVFDMSELLKEASECSCCEELDSASPEGEDAANVFIVVTDTEGTHPQPPHADPGSAETPASSEERGEEFVFWEEDTISGFCADSCSSSAPRLPGAEPGTLEQPRGPAQPGTDAVDSTFEAAEEREAACLENCIGVSIRARRCLELDEPRTEGSLSRVSEPQEVLIRAWGPSNRFLTKRADAVPCMSAIGFQQLQEAVFQRQEFFDAARLRTVTVFRHPSSNSLLGVSPDTLEVRLMEGASSEDPGRGAVVSLNGPGRSERPPSVAEEEEEPGWQDVDPCCLFIVVEQGHTCIQPASCRRRKSLDVRSSDGTLEVVDGLRWSFTLLPAEQALQYLKMAGRRARGTLRRAIFAVLVVVSK